MDEKNETLGRRIARLRLEHSMTQERLAGELGVTPQAVSKWENDLSAPDISLLPALAKTFGVSVDQLLGVVPIVRAVVPASVSTRTVSYRERASACTSSCMMATTGMTSTSTSPWAWRTWCWALAGRLPAPST